MKLTTLYFDAIYLVGVAVGVFPPNVSKTSLSTLVLTLRLRGFLELRGFLIGWGLLVYFFLDDISLMPYLFGWGGVS